MFLLPRRARALPVLLLLATVAGGLFVYKHHRQSGSLTERLRGDSEESLTALDELQAQTPPQGRLPQLLRLSDDPAPGLRYAAIDALGARPEPSAADAAERAFSDSASTVRQRALEALPKMDKTRGLILLLTGLRDEDIWIREAAVGQLRLHGDARAVPGLLSALDDPDPAVASLAMGALRKLTGQPFYAKIHAPDAEKRAAAAQWHQWWAASGTRADPAFLPAPRPPLRADPAPDFFLRDIEGRPVSLADQKGKLTLLNFWGTWCPPCQTEIPDLVRLDAAYRARGLDIVGVAVGETGADALRVWCRTHGVTYRQVLAVESVQRAYGDVHEVPVSILIDRQGRIRRRWEGERDFGTFRAAVESLLQADGLQADGTSARPRL